MSLLASRGKMKLATLDTARPSGTLLVVSADLSLCQTVGGIASSLAQALAEWDRVVPQLGEVYAALSAGHARHARPFIARECLPLADEAWWVAFHPPGTPCLVAAPGDRVAVPPDTLPAELRDWLEAEIRAQRCLAGVGALASSSRT